MKTLELYRLGQRFNTALKEFADKVQISLHGKLPLKSKDFLSSLDLSSLRDSMLEELCIHLEEKSAGIEEALDFYSKTPIGNPIFPYTETTVSPDDLVKLLKLFIETAENIEKSTTDELLTPSAIGENEIEHHFIYGRQILKYLCGIEEFFSKKISDLKQTLPPKPMHTINTYGDLLIFAENLIEGEVQISDAEITTNLNFDIKIEGNKWDGSIDYRVAKYIIAMQKSIDGIFKDADIKLDKNARPIVKFKVEEGCSLIEVNISDAIKKIMENMTGRQKAFIAVVSILAVVGTITTGKVLDYQKTVIESNTNQAIIESYDEAFKEVIKRIPTYEKPMRALTGNLDEKDTIKNSATGIILTQPEIKKEYPGKSKYKAENVYIDGNYLVTAIKLESGAITIENGVRKFDCQSSLTNKELTDLFTKVQAAYSNKHGFKIDLKITGKYFKGSNSLKDLVIFEIGSPRTGAVTIESLLD